jgi:hypothetical protein
VTPPLSIRIAPSLMSRLRQHANAIPGASVAGLAQRLIDESLRMADHPGVIFKDGPSGRRAALAFGPDIWEIIKLLRETEDLEPEPLRWALVEDVGTCTREGGQELATRCPGKTVAGPRGAPGGDELGAELPRRCELAGGVDELGAAVASGLGDGTELGAELLQKACPIRSREEPGGDS